MPPAYFIDHHVKLKEEVIKLHKQRIRIEVDVKKTTSNIEIIDVHVFKQGATLSNQYMRQLKYPMTLVDFGSRRLNVSYWQYQKNSRRKYILIQTARNSFNQLNFNSIILEFVNKFNFVKDSP